MEDQTGKVLSRIVEAPPFDDQYRGVSFFAKDRLGQWHYVNHADTWQACPPPFPEQKESPHVNKPLTGAQITKLDKLQTQIDTLNHAVHSLMLADDDTVRLSVEDLEFSKSRDWVGKRAARKDFTVCVNKMALAVFMQQQILGAQAEAAAMGVTIVVSTDYSKL